MAIRKLRTGNKNNNHNNNNNNAKDAQSSSSSSSSATLWKIAAVVLLGLVVLLVTDAIEIKVSVGSDNSGSLQELGADVVKKPKSPNNNNNNNNNNNEANTSPSEESEPVAAPDNDNDSSNNEQTPEVAAKEDEEQDDTTPAVTPVVEATADSSSSSSSSSGTRLPPNTNRLTYIRRGQPMSDEDRAAMIAKWGSWTLVDTKERPQHDYYKDYPNRDVPRTEFPSNAWQIDNEYLSKFLPESLALVERAQEAILAEYGKTEEGSSSSFEERSEMFRIEHIEDLETTNEGNLEAFGRRGRPSDRVSTFQGGWTTDASWDGLKRRLLHAVMTEDSFIFAMGGHSAAAGHGNHFQQSYTLQVQWILEAVFSRLGVRHEARNMGNGGLGTGQNSMASASTYGPDVDVLMWDSSMTENEHFTPDLMARQAILGGIKVPAIWTLRASTAKFLHLAAGADTGYVGQGLWGIKEGTTLEEILAMPWAAQYVKCTGELHDICRSNEYIGRCWIDRDDFTPPTQQKPEPGGRASWHPGNRKHQVMGRVLAFTFLQALKEALAEWNNADGYELPDDAWHLTERYEKIRNNVKSLSVDQGFCHEGYDTHELGYMCQKTMKARSMFTPRSYPSYTNILNLMRPEMRAVLGEPPKNIYNPPDVFNPSLHPPPGAIDVLNIVEAGVDFQSVLAPDYTYYFKKPVFAGEPKVPIGQGFALGSQIGDDFCNGSVDSFCNRGPTHECLLYAHNDARPGMFIDSVSGWLVMNIPDLKNGIIAVKFETWHTDNELPKTAGWTTINNERRLGSSHHAGTNSTRDITMTTAIKTKTTAAAWSNSSGTQELERRNLKAPPPSYCDDFIFEFAIDGQITTWTKEEFQSKLKQVQRVVEVVTFLNDPTFTGGVEKEVEFAIRFRGCPRDNGKVFRMSHVYWS